MLALYITSHYKTVLDTVNWEIFARIFFGNSVKRLICGVNNSRLWQDLPISVNDRVIWPFHEGLILMKLHIWEVLQK